MQTENGSLPGEVDFPLGMLLEEQSVGDPCLTGRRSCLWEVDGQMGKGRAARLSSEIRDA